MPGRTLQANRFVIVTLNGRKERNLAEAGFWRNAAGHVGRRAVVKRHQPAAPCPGAIRNFARRRSDDRECARSVRATEEHSEHPRSEDAASALAGCHRR